MGQDANVMGLYMIVSNVAVLLISAILGIFISESDPIRSTQNALTFSIVPFFLLASFCYYMSGFNYEEKMNEKL